MTATVQFKAAELVSQLEKSNISGCLKIEKELVFWKIYVQQGRLKYINCSAQSLEQLKYYLHYLGWK
jgi:two-component system, chemotaxis family, response regulator PixG